MSVINVVPPLTRINDTGVPNAPEARHTAYEVGEPPPVKTAAVHATETRPNHSGGKPTPGGFVALYVSTVTVREGATSSLWEMRASGVWYFARGVGTTRE